MPIITESKFQTKLELFLRLEVNFTGCINDGLIPSRLIAISLLPLWIV